MARRFHGGFTRRVPRRGTFWGRSPADTSPTVLAAQTAVLDSTAVPVVEGQTIVRVRGQILVHSDQQAVTENWAGAVAMYIASDQAVAVGVGSLPTPYTDQDSDLFFMHQFFGGGIRVISAAGFEEGIYSRFEFDSKAMRKFASGQTLCVVVENGSTVGLQYWLQFAVLNKVA